MVGKKKIVDAKSDDKGNISAVKLEGNSTFTSIDTVIKMTENGNVDAVVVTRKDGNKHLRSKPGSKKRNNLDNMAGE